MKTLGVERHQTDVKPPSDKSSTGAYPMNYFCFVSSINSAWMSWVSSTTTLLGIYVCIFHGN